MTPMCPALKYIKKKIILKSNIVTQKKKFLITYSVHSDRYQDSTWHKRQLKHKSTSPFTPVVIKREDWSL